MAYAVKYLLSFVSERGNDYKIQVLERDYQGEPTLKKLGSAPTLSIDESDGCIQGSSLAFAIQADVDGELQSLYTTDNKQYKVVLLRNDMLVWSGFLLPELYSENYIDPPYDVSLTASDQLATLKSLTYYKNDADVTLKALFDSLLELTQIYLPVCYHLQVAINPREDIFIDKTTLNQAAYNGYNCYDVLNALLQSMNCRLMQLNGQWMIVSATDSSDNYYVNGESEVRVVKTLGQMGVADVCPNGSLDLVNSPALKGATVEYSHILRKSLLKNADCIDRSGWSYLPNGGVEESLPGTKEEFGKTLLLNAWGLQPRNIANDNSLQLWQDVSIPADENVPYSLSVKHLFATNAKLLLMSVTHRGSDGVDRQLTAEGWVTQYNKSDVNSYIQITGAPKGVGASGIADIEQYEESIVQFMLPPIDGTLRIGFINSTENYANPLAYAPIYITQVYLTLGDVTGSTATTVVQENASTGQESVLLVYGDDIPESVNAARLTLNTLKRSVATTSWWLEGREFASYFLMMLQEYSRFYGTKKRQLQGSIMGVDVLADIYRDTHSGLLFRLVTAQYNLLDDEADVLLEEIVSGFVDYELEVFATNNSASLGGTSSAGSSSGGGYIPGGSGVGGGGGESVSGLTKVTILTKGGEEYSTNESGIVIIPDYITAAALNGYATQKWVTDQSYAKVAEVTALSTSITNLAIRVTTAEGNISTNATNITKVSNRLAKLEGMWEVDANGNLHTSYNIVVEGGGAFGKGSSSGGGGTSGGLGSVTIKTEGGVEYKSNSNGVVTVPNWITASALNGYATQSWVEGKKYLTAHQDISHLLSKTDAANTYQPKGNYLTSVSWSEVSGKPSFATVATSGKYSDLSGLPTIPTNNNQLTNGAGYITSAALNGYATQSWVDSNFLLKSGGTINGSLTISRDAAVPFYIKNTQATNSLNQATLRFVIGSNYGAGLLGKSADNNLYRTDASLSASYKIVDEGNYANTTDLRYLQLSGGTMTGAIKIGGYTSFGVSDGIFYLGNPSYPVYVRSNGIVNINGNAVIHAGNIGNQSVDKANVLKGIYPAVSSTNDLYNTELLIKYHAGFSPDFGNVPSSNSWQNGLLEIGLHSGGATAQFYFSRYKALYYRSSTDDVWNRIAYTSDNVASATKLQTARTIWGQSFDGTGNVTGTLKLYDANNYHSNLLGGTSGITIETWQENVSYLPIKLNPNGGNVLIGTTTDSGYKLDVNGTSIVRGKAAFRHTILADRYNGQGNTAGAAFIVNKGGDYFGVGASNSNISNISFGWVNDLEGTWKKELVTINASNNVILNQGVYISATDSASTARGILELTTSQNRFIIGYGIASAGYDTSLQGNNIEFTYGTSHLVGMKLTSAGNVSMYGNLTVSGGGAFGSDARYKAILHNTDIDLATIANAPLFTYKWTDREDDKVYLGTTAQYWLGTNFKDAVNTSNPDFFHLDYGALGVGLAITTAREVVKVKSRIELLEERVNELENELKQYRQWHN